MKFEKQRLALLYGLYQSSAFWKISLHFFKSHRESEIQIESWRAASFNITLEPYNRSIVIDELRSATNYQSCRRLSVLKHAQLLEITEDRFVVNYSMRWIITMLIREYSYHKIFHPHTVNHFLSLNDSIVENHEDK